MRKLITILVVLSIFGISGVAIAQGSSNGVVEGQVINGTEGGGSVAGLEVSLITYIDDVMSDTQTTRTNEEGRFQFSGLSAEHSYVVSVNYMEVNYYYPVIFDTGKMEGFIEVPVCDATTSDQAIRITLAHKIIWIEEENILITEMLSLYNHGDRTYVGVKDSNQEVLVFTLPEGATDFEAPPELMRDYLFLGTSKLAYAVPFPPGERQLVYSYKLAKPSSNDYVLTLDIDYPTDRLDVMVGGEVDEIASTQLAPAEPVETGTGEWFIHFQRENLSGGTTVDIYISNLPRNSQVASVVPWIIVAVVIIGVVVYVVRRKKVRPVAPMAMGGNKHTNE